MCSGGGGDGRGAPTLVMKYQYVKACTHASMTFVGIRMSFLMIATRDRKVVPGGVIYSHNHNPKRKMRVIAADGSLPMPGGKGSLSWREISGWWRGVHASMYSAVAGKFVAVNRYDFSVMASVYPYILPNWILHRFGSSGCSSELSGSCAHR